MINQEINQTTQILKKILSSQSHEEFLDISQSSLFKCIAQHFPKLIQDPKSKVNIKSINFYSSIRKLAESYISLMNSILIEFDKDMNLDEDKNKKDNIDLHSRKNTRATFAMRHSKNQQELKKDQIFVRLVPRTHNCIHFMVKNNNFPRIQCRLSCNQHLQYLVNYLSNKWLRGKVGVGYQIKLYPDPSTYMQMHSNEGKRPSVIHEALNNYLMFTDIMAAFGVAQNGCINLLYDITQLRKEKEKYKEKYRSLKNFSPEPKNHLVDSSVIMEEGQSAMIEKEAKKDQQKYFGNILSSTRKQAVQHQQQLSICVPKRFYGNNSIDYSQANSLGYQFNAFNSNLFGNIHSMNNSNTFLNNNQSRGTFDHLKAESQKNSGKEGKEQNKEVMGKNLGEGISGENKLQNIRNIINIIEMEVAPNMKQQNNEISMRQEHSQQKSQCNWKKEAKEAKEIKQVKTVTIIKKKNINQ